MFIEFLQPFRQITQRASQCCIDVVLFWFLRNLETGLRVLLLRVVAVLGVESSQIESCETDVEDVLVELEGPVDKPGTTIGTKFSVLHCIRTPSLMTRVF